jgi:hypothetical protein
MGRAMKRTSLPLPEGASEAGAPRPALGGRGLFSSELLLRFTKGAWFTPMAADR